jgi:hypothetical protein
MRNWRERSINARAASSSDSAADKSGAITTKRKEEDGF